MTLSDLYRVIETNTRIELMVEIEQEFHKVFIGKFYDCPVKYMEYGVKKIFQPDGHTVSIMVY